MKYEGDHQATKGRVKGPGIHERAGQRALHVSKGVKMSLTSHFNDDSLSINYALLL